MTSKLHVAFLMSVMFSSLATAQTDEQLETAREKLFAQLRQRLEGTRWRIAWGAARKEPNDVLLISVDPTRYSVIPNGFRAFVRLDFFLPQTSPAGTNYDETIYYEDLNCRDYRFRLMQLVHYDSQSGNNVYTVSPEKPKWETALPETQNEVVLESVCESLEGLRQTHPKRKGPS